MRIRRHSCCSRAVREAGSGARRAAIWLAILLCLVAGPALADRATPAWYDQNAIATAPDWHYRVPINIPAGTVVNSAMKVDVDFAALLAQLGVSGTLDVNSPRVVRSNGTLSTVQEFSDTTYAGTTDATGNGRGEIRFILEDAGAVTYYLYFDITANGAKTANPQAPINGNFETGAIGTTTPGGWTMTRASATFDAQIRGSESPSITTDGTGNPATVTTDGTPFSGSQSYLMGSRTSNEPSNSNPAVTLTKTFVKPATCTTGFTMRYRPEGWDSSWGNATQFDFFRVTLSSGATSVILVGPNATGANGNYANFPYSPNFGSNGNNAASNTNSGYGPYNGFDTNNAGGHMLGMTAARGSQPWFNPTNNLASFATGSTITLTITSTHTTQYRTWFHIDDVEWCLVTTATLGTPQGFGADITAPTGATTYNLGSTLTVTVQADAQATAAANPVVAFLYNPTGTLVAGPVNLPATGGGAYSSASVYTFGGSDPTGTWTVRIYALDASTSTIGATAGLIHIPGQPNSPQAQATYYNIDEQTFTVNPAVGNFNGWDAPVPAGTTPITGNITTKLAGTAFTLGLIRINATGTAIDTTYSQAGVTVNLLDSSNNTGALSVTTACRATWTTVIATTTVTFTAGKTTATFTVPNAYRDVRAQIVYAGNPAGNRGTGCSNDNFAIRPTSFTVTSTNATQTGTSGTPAIKTGANFNLTAASVAGYNGTPLIDNSKVVGTPNAGAIGGSFGAAVAGTGTATGNAFYYSEVGNFGMNANAVYDSTFTAVDQPNDCTADFSNALVGGEYGCNIGSNAVAQTTGSSGFGRFIPDNFNVTYNIPVFGTACGATFGYIGQPFTYATVPVMTVTARNGTNNGLANATTVNYAGAYMKISNGAGTSLNQAPYDTQGGRYSRFDALGGGTTPALDLTLLPATTADPVIGAFVAGSGTLTFSSGTGLSFLRGTTSTSPTIPFNADISLRLNVVDTDGVAFSANPAAFGTATAGNGISFSGAREMRYGRMRLSNGFGSTLIDLPLALTTEYFNSSGAWVTNTADSCTTLAGSDIRFSFAAGNLSACETQISPSTTVVFNSGVATAKLTKPGSGNDGAVTLTVNLGTTASGSTCTSGASSAATAASKTWLRGNWGTTSFTGDPTGRFNFGQFKGADPFIYLREIH